MMVPPPALRISGTAYLHIRNAPVRLTASASFQSSSVSVSTVPSGVTAAATLTSVVSLPKASTAWRTARSASSSTATLVRTGDRLPACGGDLARDRLGRIAPDIGDRDRRAGLGKPPRDRAADLAAAAGDQRDAAA